MDPNPIFAPHQMQTMFEDLIPRFGSQYNITIHSTSPFVVTIDDFLSEVEADAIINAVNKWERSTDTGSANSYGEVGRVISKSRTSSNAWCTRDCENNPYVQAVTQRIEDFTRVPHHNYESFQVLQYLPSQFYRTHHDNGASERIQPAGPRILTFFLYLSDVEEGGETRFPSLNISVTPKRGRALLWPSTLTDRPDTTDMRTMHEARPVIKGVKYAANAWIHLYNFKVPNLWGCTGAFDMK
jgi:prolyl 4-hydroxylase